MGSKHRKGLKPEQRKRSYRLGVVPDISTPDPKQHPFDPYSPGSTRCKWCAFAMTAHSQIVADAELHTKDQEKSNG